MSNSNIVLNVNGIEVIYNHVILVLKGVSLQVPEGSIVAILGGNGAGKTTTLRAVSNLLRGERGEVTKGSIELRGERIENLSPADLVQRGVVQVMEGRHCFAHLTIEENLLTGAYTRTNKAEVAANLEKVYNYFPRLKTRRTSQAAYTSGGEQQMCAIGRAIMASPNLVLLDEPSMGLAPQIVEEVFEIVKDLNHKEKVTFLLAEQNTNMALRYANYGYIMESGRIVMDGPAQDLASNEDVKEFYLGVGGGERKSFRDVSSNRLQGRQIEHLDAAVANTDNALVLHLVQGPVGNLAGHAGEPPDFFLRDRQLGAAARVQVLVEQAGQAIGHLRVGVVQAQALHHRNEVPQARIELVDQPAREMVVLLHQPQKSGAWHVGHDAVADGNDVIGTQLALDDGPLAHPSPGGHADEAGALAAGGHRLHFEHALDHPDPVGRGCAAGAHHGPRVEAAGQRIALHTLGLFGRERLHPGRGLEEAAEFVGRCHADHCAAAPCLELSHPAG